VATIALIATGCGGDGAGSTSKGKAATSDSATLSTAWVDPVGTVVTDSDGYVLYRFDMDTAEPPKSHCTGTCAALWPVAPAKDPVSLQGIDKSLVGTVTRDDGSKQLTLAGRPLYRYAKDTAPHQANGQDVDKTWFAVTPTGAKARTASSSTGGTSGGGY
jgi:predicted lipoprotein with Yx(FWY)xxD motif